MKHHPGVWLLLLNATACFHKHLETNAPGRMDVHAPPAVERRRFERPSDPGEHMVVLSGGAYGALGSATSRSRMTGREFSRTVGVEGSLYYGQRPDSHTWDDFTAIPEKYIGLNAGFDALSHRSLAPDRWYAEAQATALPVGIACGGALDVRTGRIGPQWTVAFGPLYVRGTTLLGHGTDVTGGLIVKVPGWWAWSR